MNEKLLSDMKKFGLNEYESKVYITLTEFGPSNPAPISDRCRVPLSRIYETLRSLKNKELVEFGFNSKQYKAVDPVYGLRRLLENKRQHILELENKANAILESLKVKPVDTYNIWSANGRKAFLDKITEILESSQRFAFITTQNFLRHSFLDFALLKAV